MTCLQRLNVSSIESLEERRTRTDLIWMYKILHCLMFINLDNAIKLSVNSNTRVNMYKLYKFNFLLDVNKYFFAIELLAYGILCLIVIYCTSLSSFKYKLKDINFQLFLNGHAVI